MLRKKLAAMAALSGLCLLTACSKQINEKEHPIYIRAKANKDAGRFKDAADEFNDLLALAPKSALIHKELASLYFDNIADYYRAIYHYQKYLDLAKLSQEDKQNILAYIAASKRRAAEMQIQEDPTLIPTRDDITEPALSQELSTKLDILTQNNKAFQEKFKAYREEIASLKQENESLKHTPGSAVQATSRSASGATATSTDSDTYTIQPGDTLTKIARKVYGSSSLRHIDLIRQANNLRNDRISAGQVLKIPKLPAD